VPPRRKSKPRSPEHAALGEAVRRLRDERDLSQEELADLMDTDLTQVGGIERGLRNPSYTTLVRLAAALETRPGEIVSLADRVLDAGGAEPHRETSDPEQTSRITRSQSASTPSTQP
jgi:transcriptional regulator with XRE-family HTH domain